MTDDTKGAGVAHLGGRMALQIIASGGCENFTDSLGACFRNRRHIISYTGSADAACHPCVAWAALLTERPTTWGAQ